MSTSAGDLSVGAFFRGVTGQPALVDNVLSALFHGVYGGDIDQLSLKALRPRQWARFNVPRRRGARFFLADWDVFVAGELGRTQAVIDGAMEVPPAGLFYPRGGMSSLVDALVKKLGEFSNVRILAGDPVASIRYSEPMDRVQVSFVTTMAGEHAKSDRRD